MADNDDKKEEQAADAPAPAPELTIPPTADLPVEALLALPPPTPPDAELMQQLVEMAQEGEAMPSDAQAAPPSQEQAPTPEAPSVDVEQLRAALQGAPEAVGQMAKFTPRNLAKSTVGAGIDKVLEVGGLRTPTRPQEFE